MVTLQLNCGFCLSSFWLLFVYDSHFHTTFILPLSTVTRPPNSSVVCRIACCPNSHGCTASNILYTTCQDRGPLHIFIWQIAPRLSLPVVTVQAPSAVNLGVMDTQPLKPAKMFKYGTFSGLFGGGKEKKDGAVVSAAAAAGEQQTQGESSSSSTDTSPAPAPAEATATSTASKSPSKKCVRISLIVMFSSGVILAVGLLAGLLTNRARADSPSSTNSTGRPNIIMIMTDDQDRRLGSTDYQTSLHTLLMDKGTEFTNHYTTQALCCPARSSFLRGQQVRTLSQTFLGVGACFGEFSEWVPVLTGGSSQIIPILPMWLNQGRKTPSLMSEYAQAIHQVLTYYHSGSYNKWVTSGMDNDYLPHWLNAAGYRTECE